MRTERIASEGRRRFTSRFVAITLAASAIGWLPLSGNAGLQQEPGCGNGFVDEGEVCDDGNVFDGDCCSSSCTDEETARGSEGTVPCDDGTRCADGVDNDGDGLVDAYDPECATLFRYQDWAVVGTGDRGRIVYQGQRVRVQHVAGSVPGFPVAGLCSDGVCQCSPTAPNCQSGQGEGRSCAGDEDCGVFPYPLGPSVAGVCGIGKTLIVQESIIDGPVAIEVAEPDQVRFGDGDELFIGGGYHVNFALGANETTGLPPFVGYGVCAEGGNSCIRQIDDDGDMPCQAPDWCCQPGDSCTGLQSLLEDSNLHVDRSGTGPVYHNCQNARGQLPTMSSQLLALYPSQSEGPVRVVRQDAPATITLPGSGNHIVALDSLRLGPERELIIDGPADACVLLQVDGMFSAGKFAQISLSGGLLSTNVAWSIARGGRALLTSDTAIAGTMIKSDGRIQIGKNVQFDGAAFASKIQTVSKQQPTIHNHYPFQCLLPTKLSIAKSADFGLVIAGTAFVGGLPFAAPLTYTIDVANEGPSWAPGVVVTDVLDPDTVLIDAAAVSVPGGDPIGTCEENPTGTIKCYLGTIPPGEGAQIALAVDTDPSTRGSVTNSASVAANVDDDNDPSTGQENSASVTTGIIARADLVVTNGAGSPSVSSPGPPAVGGRDTVTFVFDVTNNGPSDATGVIFSDVAPTGLTFTSAGASPQGTCGIGGGGAVSCNLGTLVPVGDGSGDSSVQVTIEATVDCDAPATINNTGSGDAVELDAAGGNESATQTLSGVTLSVDCGS